MHPMTTPAPQLVPKVWEDEPTLRRRELLWIKEGKKCHWCGEPTRMVNDNSWDKATTEHILPKYKGGTNDPENLVSACNRCNNRRSHEDQMGLPEGALLGTYKQPSAKPRASNRIALSGDEKKALLARLAAAPVRKTAEEVLREQRDQGLITISQLREEARRWRETAEMLQRKVDTMTIWQVIRRDLVEMLKEKDGA